MANDYYYKGQKISRIDDRRIQRKGQGLQMLPTIIFITIIFAPISGGYALIIGGCLLVCSIISEANLRAKADARDAEEEARRQKYRQGYIDMYKADTAGYTRDHMINTAFLHRNYENLMVLHSIDPEHVEKRMKDAHMVADHENRRLYYERTM